MLCVKGWQYLSPCAFAWQNARSGPPGRAFFYVCRHVSPLQNSDLRSVYLRTDYRSSCASFCDLIQRPRRLYAGQL